MMSNTDKYISPEISQRSFDAYRDFIQPLSDDHPQQQGFIDEAEFTFAISSQAVVSTEVNTARGQLLIPQLAPVTCYEWLNTDFYQKKFNHDMAAGRLIHFANLPDLIPGPEVNSGLMDVAGDNGVIVYDYPSTLPDYPARLEGMLSNMGIGIVERTLLGTQTYFAGQVELRYGEDPSKPHVDLASAFDARVESGLVPESDYRDGTTLVRGIADPELAEALYEMYEDAYGVLNDHPCKQGLSPEEFKEILLHDFKSGKLIYTNGGNIETLCLVENNLKKLSWVNWRYYKARYPEKFDNGQIVWFPGIATDPSKQGEDNSQNMINLMAELAEEGNNAFLGVFDFCDVNTGFLDRVFEDWINRAPQTSIELSPIADQQYHAIRVAKK